MDKARGLGRPAASPVLPLSGPLSLKELVLFAKANAQSSQSSESSQRASREPEESQKSLRNLRSSEMCCSA